MYLFRWSSQSIYQRLTNLKIYEISLVNGIFLKNYSNYNNILIYYNKD